MTLQKEPSTGIVKWFNRKKGFGFITPDDKSGDVFLHVSALGNVEERMIDAGTRMTFFIEKGDKGLTAVNATLVDSRKVKNPVKGAEITQRESSVQKRTQKSREKAPPKQKQERTKALTIDMPVTPPGDELPGDAGNFAGLGLVQTLLRAVQDAGYVEPTPIQTKAIPHVLAGLDMLGCAQTGTGKTAAFALPILQRLSSTQDESLNSKAKQKPAKRRVIRALILAPTRELAIQIGESFTTYGKYTGLKNCVVFGGVGQDPQVKALEHGIDILVATPGRLLDLIGQKFINLDHVEVLVLDEADRMLDMGFIHDVNRIIKLVPTRRQGLLFSATIPKEIVELSKSFLVKPIQITIAPDQPTLDTIKQSLYFVGRKKKGLLLVDLLKQVDVFTRTLVFTRTKHEANRVVKILTREGIPAMPIHGNKSQTARQKALGDFKDGTIRVLVATDVASRGIDVDDISHVIQYDLPNVPETYVHRMGRTGRMGAAGLSIAFCDETEKQCLIDIEKFIRMRVPVIKRHPFMD